MKKLLIIIGKILALLGVPALGCIGLLYLYLLLGTGGLFNFHIAPEKEILVLIIAVLALIGYLFFAVWLCNLGTIPKGGKKPVGKQILHTLKYIIPCALLIVLFCSKNFIESKIERAQAKAYYQQADEIVAYQNTHNTYYDILSTPLNQSSVLIDYDNKKLTFLYYFDYEQYRHYSLRKTDSNPFENLEIQFQTPLSEPGNMLTTYYKKSDSAPTPDYRYTAGAVLEMKNGNIYYTEIPDEFLDFDAAGYLYQTMQEALACADEKIVYGHNKFPDFVPDTESNTIYLDYDAHTLYILYGDSETAFCTKLELQPVADFPEVFRIQKKFELKNGFLYAYQISEPPSKWDNRTHGFLLQTPDGLFQADEVEDFNF